MKKLSILLGLPLLLTACQSDDILIAEEAANGDGNVTFTLSIPELFNESRGESLFGTHSSAAGGISNVDMTAYDLRYQLAVYIVDDDDETQIGETMLQTVSDYQSVNYSLILTPGQTYRIAVWADFVNEGSQADLHYDTSDLTAITCKDAADKQLNDESRDAYFASFDFTPSASGSSQAITLYRPFAKIRVITSDWGEDGVVKSDNFKVTYTNCKRINSFDIASGKGTGEDIESEAFTATIDIDNNPYDIGYDISDKYIASDQINRTVIVDYLMTETSSDINPIHLTIESYHGTTLVGSRQITTDVPTHRNWLTTIIGNMQSNVGEITVECDDMFENEFNYSIGSDEAFSPVEPYSEDNVYYVATADELAWISANVASLSEATVKLTADIDLEHKNWTPIDTDSNITLFDGNSKTIRNLYIDRDQTDELDSSSISTYNGLFGNASNITIQHVSIQNATILGVCGYNGAIVGFLGENGGDNLLYDCHVNNFFCRSCGYDTEISETEYADGIIYPTTGPIYTVDNSIHGCLIGKLICGTLNNCSASNFNIEGSDLGGGLIGLVYNNASDQILQCEIRNSSASKGKLWMYPLLSRANCGCFIGSFIGAVYDNSGNGYVKIDSCHLADIEFKYSFPGGTEENIYFYNVILNSKDEPWNKSYSFELLGQTAPYGPTTKYVGYIESGTVEVTND